MISTLCFASDVQDEAAYKGLKTPRDGVLVHGLFVDAGGFDEKAGYLCDPTPGLFTTYISVNFTYVVNGIVREKFQHRSVL